MNEMHLVLWGSSSTLRSSDAVGKVVFFSTVVLMASILVQCDASVVHLCVSSSGSRDGVALPFFPQFLGLSARSDAAVRRFAAAPFCWKGCVVPGLTLLSRDSYSAVFMG
jgi:hypothetical protein